ncbi:hypothetical protein PSU4_32270 [Pseudonocardia sulfidoxydans NBRC 16205]|uniref:Uncharacterized protein n=1 Tax=Pseudonocardia sulfidoxydans NBRC 16205 TaxID=1223511 RepID=A0A511DJ15_9PSEU|nr:hypothetical protein PSU4_32270 [Pseudonocardia sulfidoxydans NBRC 16205]
MAPDNREVARGVEVWRRLPLSGRCHRAGSARRNRSRCRVARKAGCAAGLLSGCNLASSEEASDQRWGCARGPARNLTAGGVLSMRLEATPDVDRCCADPARHPATTEVSAGGGRRVHSPIRTQGV